MAGNKVKKTPKIKPINNFAMLFLLSVFQLVTGFMASNSQEGFQFKVILAMVLFVATEWIYLVVFYTALHRRNFELELIAFFLCSTGLAVIGSVRPESVLNQYFFI